MEDPPTLTPITPRKRPHEDEHLTTPNKPISSAASSPLSVLSSPEAPSPLKLALSAATALGTTNNSVTVDAPQTATTNSTSQSAKRRRLTQKEKDEQRLEKEAKAKARAEKKAQKEAEEKVKSEQKRKKNEEREEKKRQKDLEQQQKEEEKQKKERSQMRLNAFFAKPKAAAQDAGKIAVDSIQTTTAQTISLATDAPEVNTNSAPTSPQKSIQKNAQSDYERYFLPFSLPSHAILAPRNAFMEDPAKLASAQARLDRIIAQEDVSMEPITIETFKSSFTHRGARGIHTASIVEIVEQVNGSSDNPIDLTEDRSVDSSGVLDVLKQIPMKYIHFSEDVRPPYYGTYTKPRSKQEARKLARAPLSRSLREANYDYDSEAEWEEPEEGEDLNSEGEEDLDDDGEDDMNDFLDDEDDPQLKRRLISGDLEPVSTGLCWEDSHGVSRLNDGSGAISTEFKGFRMGFLLEPQPHSIDPFSTAYWAPDPPATTSATSTSRDTAAKTGMKPPRLPLAQRPLNGLLNTLNGPQNSTLSTTSKPVKAKRLVPDEQLAAFKAEIEGKDLTKIGMIEALKKTFPKLPKDAITNTLTMVAKRIGPSEKEKRWVLTV